MSAWALHFHAALGKTVHEQCLGESRVPAHVSGPQAMQVGMVEPPEPATRAPAASAQTGSGPCSSVRASPR
jgi:hypothetical protein